VKPITAFTGQSKTLSLGLSTLNNHKLFFSYPGFLIDDTKKRKHIKKPNMLTEKDCVQGLP
jgi:hypothetical protein